jgi:hypothetical protein
VLSLSSFCLPDAQEGLCRPAGTTPARLLSSTVRLQNHRHVCTPPGLHCAHLNRLLSSAATSQPDLHPSV